MCLFLNVHVNQDKTSGYLIYNKTKKNTFKWYISQALIQNGRHMGVQPGGASTSYCKHPLVELYPHRMVKCGDGGCFSQRDRSPCRRHSRNPPSRASSLLP